MEIQRIKVVWICHFSNEEINEKLQTSRKVNVFAPWITHLIEYFVESEEIELHIIAPHRYIKGEKTITYKGIKCHFFNPGIPIWGRHWPGFFRLDLWTDFYFNKKIIGKITEKVKPDLIHLHGAEDAYYSSSIFQFRDKYPVLVTIQGFISFVTNISNSKIIKKRVQVEQKILKNLLNFGVRTKTMGKDILKINPKAKLHWHRYPGKEIKINTDVVKDYDCVFFSKVTKEKGIVDLLKAIGILKKNKRDISLLVIGAVTNSYKEKLLKLCEEYDILDNITWAGFLPTQKDVHEMAVRAKVSVLPVYSEIISGTIVESMFLKIPVIAYDVGSIHEVNETGEYLSLVEKGDVNSLSEEIRKLLDNDELRENRSQKAYNRAKEMFNNDNIYPDLLKAYKTIINDFKN
jgi:glycosyltransferase involved in cell wall biosynthesis